MPRASYLIKSNLVSDLIADKLRSQAIRVASQGSCIKTVKHDLTRRFSSSHPIYTALTHSISPQYTTVVSPSHSSPTARDLHHNHASPNPPPRLPPTHHLRPPPRPTSHWPPSRYTRIQRPNQARRSHNSTPHSDPHTSRHILHELPERVAKESMGSSSRERKRCAYRTH